MKKLIITVLVVSVFGVTSCKKESIVTPIKIDKTIKMNVGEDETTIDKKNVSTWD